MRFPEDYQTFGNVIQNDTSNLQKSINYDYDSNNGGSFNRRITPSPSTSNNRIDSYFIFIRYSYCYE